MNDQYLDRLLDAWMDLGPAAAPDRVAAAARLEIRSTRQSVALHAWPRLKVPTMSRTAIRLGVAAVAVVIMTVLGLRFLPGSNTGGDFPTPTPNPIASPRTIPTGLLEPGTYFMNRYTPGESTLSVPEGWGHNTNFVGKGDVFVSDGVTLAFWTVSHVYAESCRWEGTLREVGSAAELADALAEQTGHETSGPADVMLGGRRATRLVFSVAADFDARDCDGEIVRLWPDAGPNENFGLPIHAGQTTTVYVVDLDGEALVVAAIRTANSSAADVAEMQQVLSSIRFQR